MFEYCLFINQIAHFYSMTFFTFIAIIFIIIIIIIIYIYILFYLFRNTMYHIVKRFLEQVLLPGDMAHNKCFHY